MRNIAVVGAGISGLASAVLLSSKYKVTLFEERERLGGHTHSVQVLDNIFLGSNCSLSESNQNAVNIDTGFMVFNRPNYPHLSAMFDWLGVQTYPTDMSFSVSINDGQLDYCGTGLKGLFAQSRNLFSPSYWKMLTDILRFNKSCKRLYKNKNLPKVSLGEFLISGKYSKQFCEHYLLPMAGSIWSSPTESILEFPFESFVRFYINHGLLDLRNRPLWETVKDGSQTYISKLLNHFDGDVVQGQAVEEVRANGKIVDITLKNGHKQSFDAVVFACHADQVRDCFTNPNFAQEEFLAAFNYQKNQVYLHTDQKLMPKRKSIWSSWNYINSKNQSDYICLSYWMNRLQDVKSSDDYFVTLNPNNPPDLDKIIVKAEYAHPVFNQDALDAQKNLTKIQGQQQVWFTGAYLGYGFHEDGLQSAVGVANSFSIKPPWQQYIGSYAEESIQRVDMCQPLNAT